ncbi:MAG: hypothetical protein E7191_06640 [Erysipelotrichaceae bacterium]|nr:hypothetical protein [Erysipelotrichaceae bacterium]
MNKQIRQYLGIVSAILTYYLIHEGAHLLYALWTNTFKQIHFKGLGVQIEVYIDTMTQYQLGIFCILGSMATLITAYVLVLLTDQICRSSSKVYKSCMYYITIAMLFIDPVYLSILCNMFGGGDMNGISLLFPQSIARLMYGGILCFHVYVFRRSILPKYSHSFKYNN